MIIMLARIGTALLQIIKGRSRSLSVWTFQRNTNARRLYGRQRFALVKKTDDSANGDKELDAMYSWPSDR